MNRLHLSLDFDASNPAQMRALSNFTAELAELAPGARETREQANERVTPSEVKELVVNLATDTETTKEASAPTETKPAPKTKPRRNKAQVALDKEIEEKGLPPRLQGESVEDYYERTADEHSPNDPVQDDPVAEDQAATDAESPAEQTKQDTAETEDDPDPAVETAKANLRKVLSTKVKQHKDTVIKEFKKYGATNVSSLPPEHYPAFISFLKGLS